MIYNNIPRNMFEPKYFLQDEEELNFSIEKNMKIAKSKRIYE